MYSREHFHYHSECIITVMANAFSLLWQRAFPLSWRMHFHYYGREHFHCHGECIFIAMAESISIVMANAFSLPWQRAFPLPCMRHYYCHGECIFIAIANALLLLQRIHYSNLVGTFQIYPAEFVRIFQKVMEFA